MADYIDGKEVTLILEKENQKLSHLSLFCVIFQLFVTRDHQQNSPTVPRVEERSTQLFL